MKPGIKPAILHCVGQCSTTAPHQPGQGITEFLTKNHVCLPLWRRCWDHVGRHGLMCMGSEYVFCLGEGQPGWSICVCVCAQYLGHILCFCVIRMQSLWQVCMCVQCEINVKVSLANISSALESIYLVLSPEMPVCSHVLLSKITCSFLAFTNKTQWFLSDSSAPRGFVFPPPPSCKSILCIRVRR